MNRVDRNESIGDIQHILQQQQQQQHVFIEWKKIKNHFTVFFLAKMWFRTIWFSIDFSWNQLGKYMISLLLLLFFHCDLRQLLFDFPKEKKNSFRLLYWIAYRRTNEKKKHTQLFERSLSTFLFYFLWNWINISIIILLQIKKVTLVLYFFSL